MVVAASLAETETLLAGSSTGFFLAILDLNLPDAPDGEIVDFVLEKGIPPIVLTASASDDTHDEMMEKSVLDYVIKRNTNEIKYVTQLVRLQMALKL